MMHVRAMLSTAAIGSLLTATAFGCGVCIEDKIAVTYDHAVVSQALARHQVIVFTALEGDAAAQTLARKAQAAAMRARGVLRDSVRVASEPPALSFVVDPTVAAPEAVLGSIERSTPGVRLSTLRVVR
jgi:purine nucleoside phosphorylase